MKGDGTVSEEKYDLQTVLRACPEISLYGPDGAVRSGQDAVKYAPDLVPAAALVGRFLDDLMA